MAKFLHKDITKNQAEYLLLAKKKDGAFLVRESETVPGAYTLCLSHHNMVHQYRIITDKDGLLYVQAEKGVTCQKFNDLESLITKYMDRKEQNGLTVPLMYPVEVTDVTEEADSDDEMNEPVSYSDIDELQRKAATNKKGQPINPAVHRYFCQQFTQLDLSEVDGVFLNQLREFVEAKALSDVEALSSGNDSMHNLNKLLMSIVEDFQRQYRNFCLKVDLCRTLYGPLTTYPLADHFNSEVEKKTENNPGERLQEIIDHGRVTKLAIDNLKKKACKKIEELQKTPVSQVDKPAQNGNSFKAQIPLQNFEAKQITKTKQVQKVLLIIDTQTGRLIIKKEGRDPQDKHMHMHNTIRQLVKSSDNNCRLQMDIEHRSKKVFVFTKAADREHFCQLIVHMKQQHQVYKTIDQISIFIGTWNMGEEIPDGNLNHWLQCQGTGKARSQCLKSLPHDMYVFGVQESGLSSKKLLQRLKQAIRSTFREEMHVVTCYNLQAIHIIVLVKAEYKNKISNVRTSYVATGIANTLGNKGGVGVSFMFGSIWLCFVGAHLTSGHEKNNRRNQNFRDIVKGLNLGPKNIQGSFDTTNQFHHLFFLGDLNYRMVGREPEEIINMIKNERENRNYTQLLKLDQLKTVQGDGEAFVGFSEEEIGFPPTYRYEKGSETEYAWQKFKKTGIRINAPSWCDRVLWRSYPESYISNTSYGACEKYNTSDHKPVFSSFDVGITSHSSFKFSSSSNITVIFEFINAQIRLISHEHFILQFYSTCMEKFVTSEPNPKFCTQMTGYCCPEWTRLPEITPICDSREYLCDQHILVRVTTQDKMESYGEGVFSLRAAYSAEPQAFNCLLLSHGEKAGNLSGMFYMKTKDGSPLCADKQEQPKIYELIYTEPDFTKARTLPVGKKQSAPPGEVISRQIKQKASRTWSYEEQRPQYGGFENPSSSPIYSEACEVHSAPLPVTEYRHNLKTERRENSKNTDPNFRPPALPPRDDVPSPTTQQRAMPRLGQSSLGQGQPQKPTTKRTLSSGGGKATSTGTAYSDNVPAKSADGVPNLPPKTQRPTPVPRGELRLPASVDQWLTSIKMDRYIKSFSERGCRTIEKVMTLDKDDLIGYDVLLAAHRDILLTAIKDLKVIETKLKKS